MNPFVRTLIESINNTNTSITISGNGFGLLKHGGMLLIDRMDANGYPTPSSQEYITYESLHMFKGNIQLREVQRGAMGSPATSHPTGAIVEILPFNKETSEDIHSLEEELKKLL